MRGYVELNSGPGKAVDVTEVTERVQERETLLQLRSTSGAG
jgi:hypothetical protein